jgi:hypothetical protein
MRLTFEEGERELVAARLNLADDADDQAIAQAVGSWLQETPGEGGSGGEGGEGGEGGGSGDDDDDDADDDADLEAAGDDVVVVDVAEFKRLRKRDRLAGQIEESNRRRDRDELIEEAIADGKFGPARRQHYKDRYDSDSEGTKKLVARLQKNTVPLEERGVDAQTDDVDSTAYPTEWVPEVAARHSGQPQSRVHGEE